MATVPRPLPSTWLAQLRDLVRWRDWYHNKLPLFLAAMCYAALRMARPGVVELGGMAALFALLCLYAAFGHIVNDYADRDADRKAGKTRLLAGWSEPAALAAMVLPGAGAIAMAAAFFGGATLALVLLSLLIASVYSLPPLRLKERGMLAWAASSLAQRTLPLAIVFEAFHRWDGAAAGLCVLGTIVGLRFIVVHQLLDREHDRRSGVRTAATEMSGERLMTLLRWLFAVEIVSLCIVVAAMSYRAPPLALAALAYAAGLGIATSRGATIEPASYDALGGFYCVVWPIVLSLLLAVRNPLFLAVAAVAIALFESDGRRRFRAAFLGGGTAPAPPARRESVGPNFEMNKSDPYPLYAKLRGMGPVLRFTWPGLGPVWLVTRHREAQALFKDARFIRNADAFAAPGGPPPRPGPVRGFGRDLAELDPPDHTRLRKLVGKAFTAPMVERLEPRIGQLADRLLARAASRGGIELISDYATIIPITIISELLGIPIADTGRFRTFAFSLSLTQALSQRNDTVEAMRARFAQDLEAIFAARRAEPRGDLITALVQAEEDGDRLSREELIGMVYLLLVAGSVTTISLIGNGTLALLRHPDQMDLLRKNPAVAETAVEELLRYDSPIELSSICFASSDLEFGGRRLRKGAAVRAIVPSANRDEDQFRAPDRLDITRSPCPHLSFGQGIHYCLGAPLARLQGRIALGMLVERFPNLRLADAAQPTWLAHPILRGLQQLPLRL